MSEIKKKTKKKEIMEEVTIIDLDKVYSLLLDPEVPAYFIEHKAGISRSVISKLRQGNRKVENLRLDSVIKVQKWLNDSNFYKVDHAKGILSLNDDTKFLSLIKDVCESSSSNILNTRGEYFVNGDDIQFYTFIEEDKIVTCKFKYQREDGAMILLNRDVRTVQEYRKLIEPILDKYKISLRGAIQILHEPYGLLRTRNSRPYREPDSVELEECEIFEKQPDGKWS